MYPLKRHNYASRWYLDDLVSRVVAASGNPDDRFHFGKHVLQSLRDTPDFVLQIDGATGQTENCGSVLKRSVQCANAFRRLGLKIGDVIILMAPNHLDLCIPYYAALFLGIAIAPIDQFLQEKELEGVFQIDEPKLVFCQAERTSVVQTALKNVKIDAKVVAFNQKGDEALNSMSFEKLLEEFGDGPNAGEFQATDFDPDNAISLLISTSGTTGLPKQGAVSHKNVAISNYCICIFAYDSEQRNKISNAHQTIRYVVPATIKWFTAIVNFNTSVLVKFTRLQTTNLEPDNICQIIKTYKPTLMILSPTLLTTLMKSESDANEACDFTSFEMILVGGSAVSPDLLKEIEVLSNRALSPKTEVCSAYALSESFCPVFVWAPKPYGTCGQPSPQFQQRLVDLDSQLDISEPNVPGELWIKGPTIFKGYYKNPEATKSSVTEDGWFKTGDMFYRDDQWHFYFVDRIKLLLKYNNHQISPVEIQNVIRRHPGVQDVAVTAISNQQNGDLPVACVVRKKDSCVTAQEIKDLVKENLTDTKQLRGGVIFLQAIPMTPTTKVDYRRLRDIARDTIRE